MERGQTPAVIVGDDRSLCDAQQRIMRLVKLAIREIGVVSGDQWQIVAIGELDERGFAARLVRSIVAHQLDIESAWKGHRQLAQQRLGGLPLPFRQQPSERPFGSARETDQPLARRSDIGEAHGRLRGPVASQIGAADQGQQVPIPGLALHQQHDPVRLYAAPRRSIAPRRLVAAGERHFTADDRLHSRRRAGGREFERTEQIPRIGDRHRRHAFDLTQLHRFLDRDRPGRQRISGVNAQMNKIGERHIGNIAPPGAKFTRGRAASEQSDVFQRLARNPLGNPRPDLHGGQPWADARPSPGADYRVELGRLIPTAQSGESPDRSRVCTGCSAGGESESIGGRWPVSLNDGTGSGRSLCGTIRVGKR